MITTEKITAIYCRVSTDMQRERETIGTQKKVLKEFCEREGINHIQEFIDDGYSAGSLDRPAMKKLIEDIKSNRVASVVVTNTDRLTRSMADQEELLELFERRNVRFIAASQNIDTAKDHGDNTEFALGFQGFYAQGERQRTRSRVKTAMYMRAKDGKWNGGIVPFGYTTFGLEVKKLMKDGLDEDHARIKARMLCPEEKKLYIYEPEAKIVRLMYEKFYEANSLGVVRNFLNNKGLLTRNGELWARNSISRILKTPLYVGQMWYGKRKNPKRGKGLVNVPKNDWQINQGNHEPIVSMDIFEKVQKMLSEKKKARLRFDTKYLLAGILKCGKCACGMQGKSSMKKDGKIHAYYRCYTRDQRGDCDTRPVRKDLIEVKVAETILALYEGQKLMDIQSALKRHNQHLEKSKGPLEEEIRSIEKRNEQLAKKKPVLYEMVEEGTISRPDFKSRMDQISSEYQSNEEKLQALRQQFSEAKVKTINFDRLYQLVSSLPNLWKKADFNQRKAILHRIVREVRFVSMETPLSIELSLRVGDFDRTGTHSGHFANRPASHFAYTIQVKLPHITAPKQPLSFGDRLRHARMKKGLRQADLAQRIGVTKHCLGRWERLKDKPKKENLNRLKEILGIS